MMIRGVIFFFSKHTRGRRPYDLLFFSEEDLIDKARQRDPRGESTPQRSRVEGPRAYAARLLRSKFARGGLLKKRSRARRHLNSLTSLSLFRERATEQKRRHFFRLFFVEREARSRFTTRFQLSRFGHRTQDGVLERESRLTFLCPASRLYPFAPE